MLLFQELTRIQFWIKGVCAKKKNASTEKLRARAWQKDHRHLYDLILIHTTNCVPDNLKNL